MSENAIETRARYPHFLTIPTRWMDNDIYGHVNNVVYYSYFDTVINAYLVGPGGLDIHGGTVVGVCAESSCRYRAAFAFPEPVEAGLRVGHLGRSSVRYEIGLFKAGEVLVFLKMKDRLRFTSNSVLIHQFFFFVGHCWCSKSCRTPIYNLKIKSYAFEFVFPGAIGYELKENCR